MTERLIATGLLGVVFGLFLGMGIHTLVQDKNQYGQYKGIKDDVVTRELLLNRKCSPKQKG